MDNNRDDLWFMDEIKNVNPKLRFLLRKYSGGVFGMAYWLQVPEFSEKVLSIVESGEWVTDEMILKIMEEIYERKKIEQKVQKKSFGREIDFGFGYASGAMRKIRKAIREKESATGGG